MRNLLFSGWLVTIIVWFYLGERILKHYDILTAITFKSNYQIYSNLLVSLVDGVLLGILIYLIRRGHYINWSIFYIVFLPLFLIVVLQLINFHFGNISFILLEPNNYFSRLLGFILVLTFTTGKK